MRQTWISTIAFLSILLAFSFAREGASDAALSTDGTCMGACGTGCDNCEFSEIFAMPDGCYQRTTCFVSACCMNHDACTEMYGFYDLWCAYTAYVEGCSMCAGEGFPWCDSEGWYEYYDDRISWNPFDCSDFVDYGGGGGYKSPENLVEIGEGTYSFGYWSTTLWYSSAPSGDACSGSTGCTIVGTCPDCTCEGGSSYGCP